MVRRGRIYITASNLKRRDDTITLLKTVLDARAHGLNLTTKLVPENIAFFHFDDGAVEQVEVAAAYGASGYF